MSDPEQHDDPLDDIEPAGDASDDEDVERAWEEDDTGAGEAPSG